MPMKRWGAVFVLLLPALWLAFMACGILSEDSNQPSNFSLSVTGNCKSDVIVDQLIRRTGRRNGDQSPVKEFLAVAAVRSFAFSALDRGSTSHHPSLRPEIVQCWQFRWRTALDPRAPSVGS